MVTAYPVAGKQKSINICQAFVDGCDGRMSSRLRDGPAFFYGVDKSNIDIWRAVLADGRDYYYSDNAYFDSTRETYFRVTKNRLQHSGLGTSDGKRFAALGIEIKPWRAAGAHIVVCPQSTDFMRNVVGADQDWTADTMAQLAHLTRRTVVLRAWSPNKGLLAKTLAQDLDGAHALVTWSSAAAVTAVLSGVPVVTLGQCAAEPMSGGLLQIESLPTPDRKEWAGVLADNQWTLSEFRSGAAWQKVK